MVSERSRDYAIAMATRDHFMLSDRKTVDAEKCLNQGGWSLYAIEPKLGSACFVRLPVGCDLAKAPFAYSKQFEEAREVIEIALADLGGVARSWGKPAKLTVILGPGRARSTLASAVLSTQAGVWSLSEPDSFTNLARARGAFSHDDMAALVESAVKLAYTPPDQTYDHFVLKPRSQATYFAKDIASHFPDARLVYLYRDPVSWVDSMYKVRQRLGGVLGGDTLPTMTIWNNLTGFADPAWTVPYAGEGLEALSEAQLTALCWARNLAAAREAQAEGVDLRFVSHDALSPGNDAGLKVFFSVCDVEGDLEMARPVFGTDAQEGSVVSTTLPAKPLPASQREEVIALFRNFPKLLAPLGSELASTALK